MNSEGGSSFMKSKKSASKSLTYFEARQKELRKERDRELKKLQQARRIQKQKELEQQTEQFNEEEENRRRAAWGLPSKPHKSKPELKPRKKSEPAPEELHHPAFFGEFAKRTYDEVDETNSRKRSPAFFGYRAAWEPVGEKRKVIQADDYGNGALEGSCPVCSWDLNGCPCCWWPTGKPLGHTRHRGTVAFTREGEKDQSHGSGWTQEQVPHTDLLNEQAIAKHRTTDKFHFRVYIKTVPNGEATTFVLERQDPVKYLFLQFRLHAPQVGFSPRMTLLLPSETGVVSIPEKPTATLGSPTGRDTGSRKLYEYRLGTRGSRVALLHVPRVHPTSTPMLLRSFYRHNFTEMVSVKRPVVVSNPFDNTSAAASPSPRASTLSAGPSSAPSTLFQVGASATLGSLGLSGPNSSTRSGSRQGKRRPAPGTKTLSTTGGMHSPTASMNTLRKKMRSRQVVATDTPLSKLKASMGKLKLLSMGNGKYGKLGKRVPGAKKLLTPEEEEMLGDELEEDSEGSSEAEEGEEGGEGKQESWAFGPKEPDSAPVIEEVVEGPPLEPGAPTEVIGTWDTQVVSYLDVLPPRLPGSDIAQAKIVEFIENSIRRAKEFRREEVKARRQLKENRLQELETRHRERLLEAKRKKNEQWKTMKRTKTRLQLEQFLSTRGLQLDYDESADKPDRAPKPSPLDITEDGSRSLEGTSWLFEDTSHMSLPGERDAELASPAARSRRHSPAVSRSSAAYAPPPAAANANAMQALQQGLLLAMNAMSSTRRHGSSYGASGAYNPHLSQSSVASMPSSVHSGVSTSSSMYRSVHTEPYSSGTNRPQQREIKVSQIPSLPRLKPTSRQRGTTDYIQGSNPVCPQDS